MQTRKFTAATNIYRWHLAKICAGNIHRRILMKVQARFDRGPRVCLCLRCPLIHRVEQRRSNMFIAFPHFVDFLRILARDSNVNSLLPAWLRANIFVRLLNNCGNMDTRVIYAAFVPSERMFDKQLLMLNREPIFLHCHTLINFSSNNFEIWCFYEEYTKFLKYAEWTTHDKNLVIINSILT